MGGSCKITYKNTARLLPVNTGILSTLMKLTKSITKIPSPQKAWYYYILYGVPGGNRTHGLSLRRRTLYPTELRKHFINNKIIN